MLRCAAGFVSIYTSHLAFREEGLPMIFDIHTHIFPDQIAGATIQKLQSMCHTAAYSDGTGAGLKASMATAGVDGCLVLPVATSVRQVVHVNDASARLNENGPETGLWSFGCMHPAFDDWREELARIARLGLKGIKLHPVYQGVDFDDIRYLRILERAGELGLVVTTHAGLDVGFPGEVRCSPQMVRRAVSQVGPVHLILAHMGGWRNWDQVLELLPDMPVLLDTSFSTGRMCPLEDGYYREEELELLDSQRFMELVQAFGARRVLFGSDSPWGSQSESLAWLEAQPLAAADKAAILGGNGAKLLGLA